MIQNEINTLEFKWDKSQRRDPSNPFEKKMGGSSQGVFFRRSIFPRPVHLFAASTHTKPYRIRRFYFHHSTYTNKNLPKITVVQYLYLLEYSKTYLRSPESGKYSKVDCVRNVTAHAQKPDVVFRRNGRVHLNRRGRQFSRLLAAEVCASVVVMLDTTTFRGSLKSTGYPLHSPVSPSLPLPTSPCAVTFQLESTAVANRQLKN
jgi:hypothetical protein